MDINFIQIAIVLVIILLSMTLHEAMHAFVGYWLGDDTAKREGRLTLNPLKHIDPFLTILLPILLFLIPGAPIFGGAKPVPFRPDQVRGGDWGAALVAVGGPLTNLVLAFVGFGVYVLLGMPSEAGALGFALSTFVTVNLGFFLFNMIPIPPLDGSRVIYALAPEFVRSGMRLIEQYGIVLVFAIVLIASSALYAYISAGSMFFIEIFTTVFRVA
jgi:Zn-dependent protease